MLTCIFEHSELDRFSGLDRFTCTVPPVSLLLVVSPDCSLAKSSGNSSDCATVEYLALSISYTLIA